MSNLAIQIYRSDEVVFECSCPSGIELGRQSTNSPSGYSEPLPFAFCDNPEFGRRLIVVSEASNEVPRRCFRVSTVGPQIKVENIHKAHPLNFSTGSYIEPGECAFFDSSFTVELPNELSISVDHANEEDVDNDSQCCQSLNSRPSKPGQVDPLMITQTLMQLVSNSDSVKPASNGERFSADGEWNTNGSVGTVPSINEELSEGNSEPEQSYPLLDILKKTLAVVREASGSDAFLNAAVQTACQIVGLDRTVLLVLNEHGRWKTRAKYRTDSAPLTKREVSQTILKRVVKTKRTQVYDGMNWKADGRSLADMTFALGSPVLNRDGEVIAMLYGDRAGGFGTSGRIMEVEATFVEILAGAVAAGLARKEEEERRAALAGHFSPRVADLLSQHPELLDPKEAEVSVLFCDIRGFSGITEDSEPAFTFEWLQDVLSEVSECVVSLDGVLVDYVGDQLFAIWGAPDAQPDHRDRALRAATHILRKTVELRERWRERLDKPFSLGVGVSTGVAQAGNVGSRQKFKYGVLGNTVNLGSRLQDATKQLGVDCIADEACVHSAGWEDRARRLTKLQVVGIDAVVNVYEIPPAVTEDWKELKTGYESALLQFEQLKFAEATASLGRLLQQHPADKPCQLLLERAVRELAKPSNPFDAVYKLVNKA